MATAEIVEVETGPDPLGSVIWLHGLGADGHDFEPIVPESMQPDRIAALRLFLDRIGHWPSRINMRIY